MLRSIKITLILLILCKLGLGQVYINRGLKVSLVYEIGQPVHRIGGSIGFHLNLGAFQLISNNALFYAFRNYGPQKARLESQTGLTLGIGFGNTIPSYENLAQLSALSNYSQRSNIISYGVKLYSDPIGTEQLTGLVSLRIKDYFVATENDAFVFLPYDKFRTGAFTFGRYFFTTAQFTDPFTQHRASIDVLLYTGQTQGTPAERIEGETNYPSRFGYKKLNHSFYSKSSHGILRLNWQSTIGFSQTGFASIGLDNEHIRNAVQNKFIHDLPFVPSSWIKIKNPHIPMRNSEGGDYLYRENEKVRKGKFVWGVGLNRMLFY